MKLLGFPLLGSHATELIGQGTIMMHGELTTDIMENFIASHPTLSEAFTKLFAVGGSGRSLLTMQVPKLLNSLGGRKKGRRR